MSLAAGSIWQGVDVAEVDIAEELGHKGADIDGIVARVIADP